MYSSYARCPPLPPPPPHIPPSLIQVFYTRLYDHASCFIAFYLCQYCFISLKSEQIELGLYIFVHRFSVVWEWLNVVREKGVTVIAYAIWGSLEMCQIHVQWWPFLAAMGYCVFWWCCITEELENLNLKMDRCRGLKHVVINIYFRKHCLTLKTSNNKFWLMYALKKKIRDYLGIFPKRRTSPHPPFWEPLIQKKLLFFCILCP